MKKFLVLTLILSGCGYSHRNNELVGQVKKIYSSTPIFCDDWIGVDVSLGVIRGGVGSVSTEDNELTVMNSGQAATLKKASEVGSLVKIIYDVKRFSFCTNERKITAVELVK